MAPSPMCDSAVSPCFRGCLAFLHRHFPLPSLPSHPLDLSLTVNSSPRPGIAPQFLTPALSRCPFQETSIPVWGMYGCGKDCPVPIPFRLLQISCFFLSLKCLSFDSDNCPTVGMGSLLQFHHLLRAGPVLLTLLFFPLVPSSYQVLRGYVYSFPVVRYSCPLSAGVLDVLLCLKVYS